MVQDTQIQTITPLVESLLHDDIFLVHIKIKPTNNIKIYLDADSGLSIEKCIKINRALYKIIEEKALYPGGDFSLEVSSPGIDEPLRLLRQYHKNVGRNLEVQMTEGPVQTGKLVAVTDATITLEQTSGKGKKAQTTQVELAFEAIKQAKVQISF